MRTLYSTRGWSTAGCARVRAAAAGASILLIVRSLPSQLSFIVDPAPGQGHLPERDGQQDQEEHPGQGRGVAHVEILECVAIEIEQVHEGCVGWPYGSHDVHLAAAR